MKIILYFLSGLLFFSPTNAQLLKVSPGSDITILAGTTFSIDKLAITPTADFTISDLSISKSITVSHATSNPYISRVYQFSNNSNAFTGSIQFGYADGAELNGIPENALTLNIHNGIAWAAYSPTTRDNSNNFVLINSLTGVVLNELTLANQLTPLPVSWLRFTATKQQTSTKLEWTTAFEQNSKNYTVQHSINGFSWADLITLPATGNSNSNRNYEYIHQNPAMGINYYRIIQTDLDNSSSYSLVRTVLFTEKEQPFIVFGNPITDGILAIQVNVQSTITMFTAEGRLLWQSVVNPGAEKINVSMYAKGVYFLRAGNNTEKIIIQ